MDGDNGIRVEAGGESVLVREPDWMECLNVVGVLLDLDIERTGEGGVDMGALTKALLMRPQALARILGIVTDHPAEWYMERGRVKGGEFMDLLTAAVEVIPFSSLIAGFGKLGVAFVSQFGDSQTQSEPSSPSDAAPDSRM